MILAVCNPKGGSGKSTTAAYLAHALAEQERQVVVIDADHQLSLVEWADDAKWSIPVRGMPSPRLHVAGSGIDREARDADDVVVDTPGTQHNRAIVESAIRAATVVVVPLAPTSMEVKRMAALLELIQDVSHLGRHGAPPRAYALFNRVVAGAASTGIYREELTDGGWSVLRTVVPRWERYAQAEGGKVLHALDSHYGDALREIQAAA